MISAWAKSATRLRLLKRVIRNIDNTGDLRTVESAELTSDV